MLTVNVNREKVTMMRKTRRGKRRILIRRKMIVKLELLSDLRPDVSSLLH